MTVNNSRRSKFTNALEMGLASGIAGLFIGLFFSYTSNNKGIFELFWAWSAPSAMLTGTIIWYLMVVRSNKYSIDKGAVAGIVISLVGQLLHWYAQNVTKFCCYFFTGKCTNSFGEPPANLFKSIPLSGMLFILAGC